MSSSSPDSGDPVTSLSEHQLSEKIERLKNMICKGIAAILPDKGEKIRLQLQQCEEEIHRRRRTPPKDLENDDRLNQSKCAEPSGSIEDSKDKEKDSPSSFAKLFNKKIESKLGVSTSKEEIRIASQDTCKNILRNNLRSPEKKEKNKDILNDKKDKYIPIPILKKGKEKDILNEKKQKDILNDKKENDILNEKKQKDILNDKKEKDILNEKKEIDSLNGKSFSLKTSLASASVKRKRLCEIEDSTRSKSKKDKEVVLLDEEKETPPQQSTKNTTEWVEVRVCYPSSEDPNMVELSCSDLKCLDPEEYLSSPVMNFYIMYLQRQLPGGAKRSNCYFFNTYFYNKLQEAFSPKENKKKLFLKLRRWWKGVNIFQQAYIFMPVYGDMHWSLVIICMPPEDDNSGPIVLHLDSLVYHNSIAIFDTINTFLKEEWSCIDHPNKRKSRNLPGKIENKIVKVPQQKNEYDCGLFVLYFMERFFEKAPETLRKKDLSLFGIRWFEKVDASALRNKIKSLLLEVFENSKFEHFENSNSENGTTKSISNIEDSEDEN